MTKKTAKEIHDSNEKFKRELLGEKYGFKLCPQCKEIEIPYVAPLCDRCFHSR